MFKSLPAHHAALPDRPTAEFAARAPGAHHALDARLVERHLGQLLQADGVLGCALVDAGSGTLVAEQGGAGIELDAAASAGAQAMRAQIAAARRLGLDDIDEMTITTGARQQLMRSLPHRPELFLLALLDRRRANVALARFRMVEAQRNLS
jgi:predicted regulator of Ras-like GTPase activity (Roadblock/LC7/MglB family)